MTIRKTAIIAIIYLLGVGLCLNWRFADALFVFQYKPLLIFLAALVPLAVFDRQASTACRRLLDLPARYWIAVCSLTTFSISLYFAYGPLEAIPHAFDDVCYLWMAKAFAMGRLYMDSHPLPEFFQEVFFINDGRWYPLFQPGWPLLLSLGVTIGLPYLLNPLLLALSIVLAYCIGRRVFDERIAKLAIAMLAVSQLHNLFGAFLFAHALALVLSQAAILFSLRLYEKNRLPDALGLAFVLGWLFTTRALNSVLMSFVVAVLLAVGLYRRRIGFTRLLAGIPLGLLFIGLQLGYNHALTGDAWTFPQDRYFALTEENPECHRLGFGPDVGCFNLHTIDSFPQGFGPVEALSVSLRRMDSFIRSLSGWSILFIFIGAALFTNRFGYGPPYLLSVFAATVFAYFFFYYHGVGGRYYYESGYSVIILIAGGLVESRRGLCRLAERIPEDAVALKRIVCAIVPAMLASYFLFNLFFFLPSNVSMLGGFFGVDRRYEKMADSYPEKSIFFIGQSYQAAFLFNSPGLSERKLFARDLGLHNRLLMQYYPGWNYYRYDPQLKAMTKIEPVTDSSSLFIEAEHKYHSGDSSGEYMYFEICDPQSTALCSQGSAMIFKAKAPGSYAAFDQYIFEDGNYEAVLNLVTGPDRGILKLSVDGQACEENVDLYSPHKATKEWKPRSCSAISLKKGKRRILFEVTAKHPESKGHAIGIDWIEFKKNTEGKR